MMAKPRACDRRRPLRAGCCGAGLFPLCRGGGSVLSWESNALGWATVVRDSRVGGSAVAWFGVGARVVRGSWNPV